MFPKNKREKVSEFGFRQTKNANQIYLPSRACCFQIDFPRNTWAGPRLHVGGGVEDSNKSAAWFDKKKMQKKSANVLLMPFLITWAFYLCFLHL